MIALPPNTIINPGFKLMLMGSGRHGKGTFCDIALRYFGITSLSSSRYACDTFLFDKIKDRFGYATADECYADRHRDDAMRELWYQEIFDFNTPNRDRLGRGIFALAPIYDGVRDDLEFGELKSAGAFDLSVWIDASKRVPPEPSSSIKVTADHADVILTNNGTPAEFVAKVHAFLSLLKAPL